MQLSVIRQMVQDSLDDDGVYRTDSFVNACINRGYQMLAHFVLFDQRRASISATGSRNHVYLPDDSSAHCIAPLYLANGTTGKRVHPILVNEFSFESNWEGDFAVDSAYYTLLSPFHHAFAKIVTAPAQVTGPADYTIIGAFEPVALSADTDEPRMPEEFQDILIIYARFEAFIGDPGQANNAIKEYQRFIDRMIDFIETIKMRFPGGRDFEPKTLEFPKNVDSDFEPRQKQEVSNG